MASSKNAYEEAIARAKAALESYSSVSEELARLYENAKQNARTAYEAQKEQTSAQAAEARRQADVNMQRTERNLDQRLASRGLSLSGENAQTRLDLLVAMRNQLAGIDSDEREQLASLDQALADRTHELDMAYAGSRADSAKQLASLNADLAAAEANKAAAEAASQAAAKAASQAALQAAAKAPSGSQGSGSDSSEAKVKDLLKGPLQLGETFKSMSKNLMKKFQGLPVDFDGKGGKGTVVPEVSARNLAAQLVKAAGSSGKISGSRQQASLSSLLNALMDSVDLDRDYYDELMLNLRSLGYRPDYAQSAEEEALKLQGASRDVYDTMYRRYFNIYRNAGYLEGDAGRKAEKEARYRQIHYLYTHSYDKDEFDYATDTLGLNGYLNEFYDRISEEKPKVKLGSEL